MQLWHWLKGGKRQIELPDMIWLANRARLEGVCQSLEEKSPKRPLPIVTSHFSDRLAEMRDLFNRNSIHFREADHLLRPHEIHREFAGGASTTPLLAPASLLAYNEPPSAKDDPSYRVAVLVVERHPVAMFDERIERFAATIPCQSELQFFLSLDDAVMQMFAGERVREILQRLGMKEDEAITSKMVVRRLKGAQRKVKERYESLQGLKRGLALERLREEPPREWKSAAEWLAAHGMDGN